MNSQTPNKNSKSDHAQPLIDFINRIYPLSDEIKEFIIQNTSHKKVPKGKYLLKAGEICNEYYFIYKGILRSFLKFEEKEITIWINPEDEITTAIRSMTSHEPADEYIQAIESCELVVIPFGVMQELYERFPEMNKVGRMLLEEYYAASEERVYICRIPNAESRYRHFIESRPELANRISLKYIASYLGMTLETLSRLRGKRAGKQDR
ncbi:MAG: Crp/Fnr family transcriptional regulator [Chitinophagaceae bacterium]|nr:Crp/Fnr family transcriptional regulator [Chitinophagaceae bacterium]